VNDASEEELTMAEAAKRIEELESRLQMVRDLAFVEVWAMLVECGGALAAPTLLQFIAACNPWFGIGSAIGRALDLAGLATIDELFTWQYEGSYFLNSIEADPNPLVVPEAASASFRVIGKFGPASDVRTLREWAQVLFEIDPPDDLLFRDELLQFYRGSIGEQLGLRTGLPANWAAPDEVMIAMGLATITAYPEETENSRLLLASEPEWTQRQNIAFGKQPTPGLPDLYGLYNAKAGDDLRLKENGDVVGGLVVCVGAHECQCSQTDLRIEPRTVELSGAPAQLAGSLASFELFNDGPLDVEASALEFVSDAEWIRIVEPFQFLRSGQSLRIDWVIAAEAALLEPGSRHEATIVVRLRDCYREFTQRVILDVLASQSGSFEFAPLSSRPPLVSSFESEAVRTYSWKGAETERSSDSQAFVGALSSLLETTFALPIPQEPFVREKPCFVRLPDGSWVPRQYTNSDHWFPPATRETHIAWSISPDGIFTMERTNVWVNTHPTGFTIKESLRVDLNTGHATYEYTGSGTREAPYIGDAGVQLGTVSTTSVAQGTAVLALEPVECTCAYDGADPMSPGTCEF
jgi:hypothetical protein